MRAAARDCITQFAIAILVESLDNGLTGGSISTSIRLFAGSLLGRSLVGCGFLLRLSGVQADAEQKCNSKVSIVLIFMMFISFCLVFHVIDD